MRVPHFLTRGRSQKRIQILARGICGGALALMLMAVAGWTGAAPGSSLVSARGTALRSALRQDLSQYLTERKDAEHISAVSLQVTYPGTRPSIGLAVGTTSYGGGPAVSPGASWQIGSNTKAFTSIILLQLEAEGRLSIHDTLGKWLPQYPAWKNITIEQLLSMTSRIPDYLSQPAAQEALAANPTAVFSDRQLVSYVTGLPLLAPGWNYSNTNYILAQMIIDKATGDSYSDQLTKRIFIPLRLRTMCNAPYTCRPATAAAMPDGYFWDNPAPLDHLNGTPVPKLALTFAQGAGGLVGSLGDLTTWDRALYQGELLPKTEQRQLESLVSQKTGRPIPRTTLSDPAGYGLGVAQETSTVTGTIWAYEGETFGYRVLHLYQPASGVIIALATNSAAEGNEDQLGSLAVTVFKTLQAAGALSSH